MEPQQFEEGYISVKEAAKRIGYSLRQTDRFIQAGKLEAVHYSPMYLEVILGHITDQYIDRTHS